MKRSVLYIFIASFSLLTGCISGQGSLGADDVKVNTILVKDDGTVQVAIVEDFEKPYYNEEELTSFIQEEIVEYNKTAGVDSVIADSLKVDEGIAKIVFTFDSMGKYADFNEIEATFLTTKEALTHEDIPDTFVNIKGDTILKEEALGDEDYKVVIINEPIDVRVDGKVKYYSNAILLNDKSVQSSEDSIAVIVFKP